MITSAESGINMSSSSPDRDCLHSLRPNSLRNDISLFFPLPIFENSRLEWALLT